MKHLNVKVPDELQSHLSAYSRRSGMTKRKLVELALMKYFNDIPAPDTMIARPLPKL